MLMNQGIGFLIVSGLFHLCSELKQKDSSNSYWFPAYTSYSIGVIFVLLGTYQYYLQA